MSIETLIPLVVKHNSLIIQALVSLILFLVMVVAYRNFVRAKKQEENASHGAAPDMSHLEETLKKLLEKADKIPTAAVVHAGGGAEQTQHLVSEIETLRQSLQEKQEQIEQLKSAPATESSPAATSATPSASNEERDAFAKQLRDLQAKLSEYEIISEDIADLSRFKDENAKLQQELAALKAGGAASMAAVLEAATAVTAAAAAPTPEPAVAAAAPAPAPTPESAVGAAPAPAPPAEIAPASAAPISAAPVSAPAASAIVETERPDPAAVLSMDDDLIKEFAEAVNAQAAGNLPPAAAGVSAEASLFDVDRMTAEAGELIANVGSGPEVSAEEALGQSLDPEKIAAEAAKMEAVKPEDAKLMGEFEDFMKKGGIG